MSEAAGTSPSPSAEAVDCIEELLTEILRRLPIKSIIRFKAACKRWCNVISQPSFSLLLKPEPKPSGIIFSIPSGSNHPTNTKLEYEFVAMGDKKRPAPFKSLTFAEEPHGLQILHSCQGLLLCCSRPGEMLIYRNYYVYNPTTNQFATIKGPASTRYGPGAGAYLAFDPSRSLDWKIILFEGLFFLEVDIYSRETSTWTKLKLYSTPYVSGSFCNGVFFNGSIYTKPDHRRNIVRFDVDENCLDTIPKPPSATGGGSLYGLFLSQGHLLLIREFPCLPYQFDVIELVTDKLEWVFKYRVDCDVLTGLQPVCPPSRFFSLLYIVGGESEDDSLFILYVNHKILSYNVKKKSSEILCKLMPSYTDEQYLLYWETEIHSYYESLLCV